MSKFCKDCQHSSFDEISWKCLSPRNMELNLITGQQSPRYTYCNTHRGGPGPSITSCGPQGSWFEPKVNYPGQITFVDHGPDYATLFKIIWAVLITGVVLTLSIFVF